MPILWKLLVRFWSGPDYLLCRLYHAPRRKGAPPISCQIFTKRFWRLNVQCTLKRNDNEKLFWEKSVPPQIRKSCTKIGFAYEKRAPALRWCGPPEWLIRPWFWCIFIRVGLRSLTKKMTPRAKTDVSAQGLCFLGHCSLIRWWTAMCRSVSGSMNRYGKCVQRRCVHGVRAPTSCTRRCPKVFALKRLPTTTCCAPALTLPTVHSERFASSH